jgi:hypothetical protein
MDKAKPRKRAEPEPEPELDVEGGEEAYYKLFPAEGSADEKWTPVNPAHVMEVRLYRLDGGHQDHLDNYSPGELADERAVRRLHGGGKYLAIAIDARPRKIGRVMRRRVFTLRGDPIEPKAAAPPPPAAAPAAANPDELPGWVKSMLAAAGILVPPVLAYMKDSSAKSDEERRAQTTLLVEAMKGDRNANTELLKILATPREPASPPAAVQPAAGGSVSSLKELVECMKALGFKKDEPDDFTEVLKIVAPMLVMGRMGGGVPGAPPAAMPAVMPVLN